MSILGFICIHLEKDGPDRLLNESYTHWNPLGREETERVLVRVLCRGLYTVTWLALMDVDIENTIRLQHRDNLRYRGRVRDQNAGIHAQEHSRVTRSTRT